MAAVPSIGRASLVDAPARAPQAAATEGLYERHAAKILGYCLHQLGSREEAEDAVQTTFMNAFRALGRGVVPESESAWLFKIAENVCLSRRRSSWRRGRIESPSDFDVIEEIVPGPSRQRDELIGIENALASMPEQQRRAILLREWQGLSYREIAEELEVSQSAVETLIFRARRSLAQGLEQPDLQRKPKRKSFRRALHVLDVGSVLAAVKALLAGSAAVKATAAAVAVTAAAGTAASVTPKLEGHSPQPAPPMRAEAAAPRPVVTPPEPRAVERVPQAAPTVVTPTRKRPTAKVEKEKVAKAAAPRVRRASAAAAEPPLVSEARLAKAAPSERVHKSRPDRVPATKARERTPEPTRAVVPPEAAAPPETERAPKQHGRGKDKRELASAPVAATIPEVEPATDSALDVAKGRGHDK